MEKYFLTFDAGTQSVKVAVYDVKLHCVAAVSHPTTLVYPQPGWVEMDAEEYLQLTLQGMKECRVLMQKQGLDVRGVQAIMGDGIICGIVGVDAFGKAVTPFINYLDSRTKQDAQALADLKLELWRQETGNAEPLCMFPALFARWFLRNQPEFRRRGVKFLHNAPYVLLNLAGLKAEEAFIDWGTLSGWGLGYNVVTKTWSPEQLKILEIAEGYLPRIVKPWDRIGGLSAQAAALTGLPAGIPICAGAGDTMQSMLGCGIFEAGRAVDVAGTCAMFCVSTKGIIPELSVPKSGLIFNSGTLPDTYFYWGFVRTGGLALRWFKDNICRQADGSYYDVLNKEAAQVAPGAEGVAFLPYLTGGYGDSDVKGCFINMTMATNQAVLWRAVLEAIAFDYREVTDTYRSAGLDISQITVTEGGSRSALWNQIKADALEAQVLTYATSGGAVVMDALVGAYATGQVQDLRKELQKQLVPQATFTPCPERSAIYKRQRREQQQLLAKLNAR